MSSATTTNQMPEEFARRDAADQAAAAFPPLLIAARRIADTLIHGLHGRRRAGPGEEFWQFRPYSPGDAASRIDWRRSAQRDRLFVRETEWAATNTLWSWAARGPGMDFRSGLSQTSKADRAILIALTISVLAVKGGERVAGLGAPFSPGHTRNTLINLAHWFSSPAGHSGTAIPTPQSLPRFSTCLLVSDFLDPIDELREQIRTLAAHDAKGHLVQVLDPAEETFPYQGRVEFENMAGSDKLLAGKAETLRKAYVEKLTLHRQELANLTRSLGWTFTVHHTDRPPHSVLLPLYQLIAGEAPGQQLSRAG